MGKLGRVCVWEQREGREIRRMVGDIIKIIIRNKKSKYYFIIWSEFIIITNQ